MQLTFLILSIPHYRTLGPIIEAAAKRSDLNATVVLGPSIEPGRVKSYQSATLDNIPQRLQHAAQVIKPQTLAEYVDVISSSDAVLALAGAKYNLDLSARLFAEPLDDTYLDKFLSPQWALVADSFYINDLEHSDLVFWTGEVMKTVVSEAWPDDLSKYRGRIVQTGYVRADIAALLDRETVRNDLGIPKDKPCVLYVPDSYVTRRDPSVTTPWYSVFWSARSRWSRFKDSLLTLRSPSWALRGLLGGPSHFDTLKALRQFCDANNAFLLMVPRRMKDVPKGPLFLPEEAAIADGFVPANETYPQAMMLGILASDLVVCGYRSGTILDAAALGRFIVFIDVDAVGFADEAQLSHEWFDKGYGLRSGFHLTMPANQFIRHFSTTRLEDYAISAPDLENFRSQHTGPVDGNVSRRILAEISESVLRAAHSRTSIRPSGSA
ncbi:MAG: hypothetical protein HQL45_00735 [Alphaproteobacteria bacterium]|nr:hypothetical protein [Alphaproteobacteria bacterium]